MKKTILVSCLIIAVALVISFSRGTTAVNAPPPDNLGTPDTTLAVALSLEDMVSQSDVIAIGSCTDIRSVWADGTLVTLATVAVSETLKGAASGTLTVVLPGGADANRKFPVAVSYPGAPRLVPGENAFLFLSAESEVGGGYTVAGFAQGKFSIVNDESGEPVVTRDLTQVSLQGNNGVRRGGANATALSSFKAQVKGLLNK
jgi:hypothetical protein